MKLAWNGWNLHSRNNYGIACSLAATSLAKVILCNMSNELDLLQPPRGQILCTLRAMSFLMSTPGLTGSHPNPGASWNCSANSELHTTETQGAHWQTVEGCGCSCPVRGRWLVCWEREVIVHGRKM
jgi:hypothetical protein